MSTDTSYDKIKPLVEIEDDIFAVFTINSREDVNGLTVVKNIDFENSLVENIYHKYFTIGKTWSRSTNKDRRTTDSKPIIERN